MRFVQFKRNGVQGVGVELVEGGDLVDVCGFDSTVPTNMRDFIAGGTTFVQKARSAINSGKNIISRKELTILAPITNPDKVICIGMNYVDHCAELGFPVPTEPVVFSKFNTCIVGPDDDIPYPSETQQLDWEVELTIVIGQEGKNIAPQDAMDYVFGYTTANDISARDWQKKTGGQVLIAKGMDGTCPLGPAIVTKDEVAEPHNLNLWTKVNGTIKQDSNTRHQICKTEKMISHLSRFFTLKPGDIILTGTPPGIGVSRNPPEFLQVGDVVEVGIESIGTVKNRIAK